MYATLSKFLSWLWLSKVAQPQLRYNPDNLRSICLTRHSVCAGDDVVSHKYNIEVREDATLLQALDEVKKINYLAKIASGKATWVVELPATKGIPESVETVVAIVAQQWEKPKLLPAGKSLSVVPNALHFRYLGQDPPDLVYADYLKYPYP